MLGRKLQTSVVILTALAVAGVVDVSATDETVSHHYWPKSGCRIQMSWEDSHTPLIADTGFDDPDLMSAVATFFESWVEGKPRKMVELAIPMSDEHLLLKEGSLRKAITEYPITEYFTHSVDMDPEQPWWATVYTNTLRGETCDERISGQKWIKMGRHWYWLPATGRLEGHTDVRWNKGYWQGIEAKSN